jgi:hypothetical protein
MGKQVSWRERTVQGRQAGAAIQADVARIPITYIEDKYYTQLTLRSVFELI